MVQRFSSLPSTQRFACVGLIVVIIGVGAWSLVIQSQVKYEWLLGGRQFSLREIAKIEAAFAKAGLKGAQISEGRIRVPESLKNEHLQALDAAGAMPIEADDIVQKTIASQSPFDSRRMSEIRLQQARKQKLARILSEMNGVETATVQYDEQNLGGLHRKIEKRAFVAVKGEDGQPLSFEQIETIRETTAGYFGVTDHKKVVVTDLHGRAYNGESATTNSAFAAKESLEKKFRDKIQTRLGMYSGLVVEVTAHLPSASESNVLLTHSPQESAWVTASIGVPQSHFLDVWQSRKANLKSASLNKVEEEIRQKIQQEITVLLPPPPLKWQSLPQVTVTAYQDHALSQPPTVSAWKDTNTLVGAIAFAIVLAVFGFWGARRQPNNQRSHSSSVAEHVNNSPNNREPVPTATEQATLDESQPTVQPKSSTIGNEDLRKRLGAFVQNDIKTASATLKHWVDSAA